MALMLRPLSSMAAERREWLKWCLLIEVYAPPVEQKDD